MSVIGPRPGLWNQDILTAERDKYNANDVKPGLTGCIPANPGGNHTFTDSRRPNQHWGQPTLGSDPMKYRYEIPIKKLKYSARVIHKLLRLARTSADLDGEEKIRQKDIEKVLTCRELDKSNSKMVVVK